MIVRRFPTTARLARLCKILGQVASVARSLSRTTSGNLWKVRTGTGLLPYFPSPECRTRDKFVLK